MARKEKIPFIKMHGLGNDYIYVNTLHNEEPTWLKEENIPETTRKISNRHFGVGSDGMIIIGKADNADFSMRIFNADGSEAKMCGNGIRCVGKYVHDLGFTDKDTISVSTLSGIKHLKLIKGQEGVESVMVDMGSPFFKRCEIPVSGDKNSEMKDEPIEVGGEIYKITGVGMGNPHGVVFVDDVDILDLDKTGPGLEHHPIWPDRANIEFVEVMNRQELKVRVWERGSGETLACGTGACASAVASFCKGLSDSEVKVHLKGGNLKIKYDHVSNKVFMTGPATFVAEGTFKLS